MTPASRMCRRSVWTVPLSCAPKVMSSRSPDAPPDHGRYTADVGARAADSCARTESPGMISNSSMRLLKNPAATAAYMPPSLSKMTTSRIVPSMDGESPPDTSTVTGADGSVRSTAWMPSSNMLTAKPYTKSPIVPVTMAAAPLSKVSGPSGTRETGTGLAGCVTFTTCMPLPACAATAT